MAMRGETEICIDSAAYATQSKSSRETFNDTLSRLRNSQHTDPSPVGNGGLVGSVCQPDPEISGHDYLRKLAVQRSSGLLAKG